MHNSARFSHLHEKNTYVFVRSLLSVHFFIVWCSHMLLRLSKLFQYFNYKRFLKDISVSLMRAP